VGVTLFEEELALYALAHQAALHVGERRDDGVDGALGDLLLELLQRGHPMKGAGTPRARGVPAVSTLVSHGALIASASAHRQPNSICFDDHRARARYRGGARRDSCGR